MGSSVSMRRFELHRDVDETGVSGVGVVAEGVEFSDGHAALRWRSEHRSTAVYASMDDVEVIHGHGGRTRVVYLDVAPPGDRCCCIGAAEAAVCPEHANPSPPARRRRWRSRP